MSNSYRASNRGTNARKSDRPRKGKDQAEREELSLTRSLMEGKQQAHWQPQGARRTDRKRRKSHPKEKTPSLKDNLPTGGRTRQVNLEVDRRTGEHNGENQESPKIRSHRGTPVNRAPAATGRKAEPPTKAPTPAGRKEGRVRKTTPDP